MKSIEVKGTARTIAERSSEQARALKAIRKDNGVLQRRKREHGGQRP